MREEIADYLRYQEALNRTPATLADYRHRLRYFHQFAVDRGIRDVRSITGKLIQDYHDSLIERGLSKPSQNTYLTSLRSFLMWLEKRRKILGKMSGSVVLPKTGSRLPPTIPSPEQLEKRFDGLPLRSHADIRNRGMLELFYAAGLRLQELIGLNVKDLDTNDQTLFVRGKGQKDRVLPIHDRALAWVQRHLSHRGQVKGAQPLFVLDRTGNRINTGVIAAVFRRLNQTKGKAIIHLHPHLLRHCFAVHLLQNGADIRYVQALLGHENPDTTSRYLGLVKDDLKAEYDRAMELILRR